MNITQKQLEAIKEGLYLAEWFVDGVQIKPDAKNEDNRTLAAARKVVHDVLNEELVDEAINTLCAFVRDRLGVRHSNFAEVYWSSDSMRYAIDAYVDGERSMK